MITELFIISPLVLATIFGYIPFYLTLGVLAFIYQMPKMIFMSALEYFAPDVINVRRCLNSRTLKLISLTFDDVPFDPKGEVFREILDILNGSGMKGTFFIISSLVSESTMDILIQAVKDGHQLGNHGNSNTMHFLLSNEKLREEITTCDTLIKEIYSKAGVPLPKRMVYRPGCGLFGPSMLKLVKELGYELALGSVYPNDPMVRSSFINYHYLIRKIWPGDIVIVHDRVWTVPMLKNLVKWLKDKDLTSATIDDILA